MALSGSTRWTLENGVFGTFEWNVTSQSVEYNSSTISWTLKINVTRTVAFGGIGMSITVEDYVSNLSNATVGVAQTKQVGSGTFTLKHNSTGTKSFVVYFRRATNREYSASFTLDSIPRPATITNATNFTDEGNPTIYYSNPSGNAVDSLQACISWTGSDDIAYRDVSKTGTSYTFNLTESERTAIREAMSTVTSMNVTFYLVSVIRGISNEASITKTVTITNANPTFTVDIVDENQNIGNLTGDAVNKFVKGHSDAQVTITSSPKKGAYIVSETVVCGTQTLDYGSGTIYAVESSEFIVTVTDSRGLTTTQTIYKQLVNYITLTCNLEVNLHPTNGEAVLGISGNCFYGSFGLRSNTLTISYRYRTDSTYSSWHSATVTVNENNTYSVNYTVTGLDYTKTYTFEAFAADAIEEVYSAEVKAISKPVFDWGETDFNFNVPVNFSKGFTQPLSALKQIWNGNYQMIGGQSVEFNDETVSSQANGIVLVFTPYDPSTGLANDEKLMSFFVSKKAVQVMPRKMHTFYLISGADFGTIGAKSVYIADEKISGYATNDDTGSNNGITYANNKFVLRYVLGV